MRSKLIILSIVITLVSQTETILIDSTNINLPETEISNTSETASLKEAKSTIIPSQGFSFNSLWRGVLGMITLPPEASTLLKAVLKSSPAFK